MKLKHMLGIALAGAFACSAGISAAGAWNGYEVRTPSSVNESAPWLANQPHMPAFAHRSAGLRSPALDDVSFGTGASSNAAGAGSVGFESTLMSSTTTEYWMLGSGATASSGSGDVSLGAPMSDGDLMVQ
jgi:hypothetical protein